MNVSSLHALAFLRGPLGLRGSMDRSAKRAASVFRSRSAHPRRRRGISRFEQLEARLALAVTVTNTNDTGAGSLREAITTVNAAAIANTITFQDLAVGTIALASELPALTNTAGTTFTFGGTTTGITLDGASAAAADGLTIAAGANSVVMNDLDLTIKNFDSGLKFLGGSTGSTINGLTLSGNNNGIELVGGGFSGSVISGNTITLNNQNGIVADAGVTSLTIGGTATGAGNTISENGSGVSFASGTYTGTNVQGNAITSNNQSGLSLQANGGSLTGLTIGGTTSGAANTISDNTSDGLTIESGTYTNTVIAGNTIASNSGHGIFIDGGATSLTIGGIGAGAGNTILKNDADGIFLDDGAYTGTVIQGNTISSNEGSGVSLGSATGLTTALNTISFNQQSGIEVADGAFTGTVIQSNNIAYNFMYGIQLFPAGNTLSGLTIGGSTSGQGNMIASNGFDGIGVFGGDYTGTAIRGNTIRFNRGNGVNINYLTEGKTFTGLLLGGGTGAGNTISNNGLDGVQVNAGTYILTFVQGNTITSNARNGVNFNAFFGGNLTGLGLGGTGAGEGNTITNNVGSGLEATKGDYTLTTVAGNTISGNPNGITLTNTTNLAIGGTLAALKNTVSSNTTCGLFATGVLTGTKIRGNAFSSNPMGVSLQSAQGISFGTAETGGGNTITGGATGMRAVGDLSSSVVSGNAITGQTTGIQMINATGASSATPFFVGGAATKVGNGAGNYVASTVHGLYAAGTMTNTTIAGNIFSASSPGGNAMVLENATGLTVGGSTAGFGNTLTAAQGNGLWATGYSTGTGFYKNTLTASKTGAVLINATSFLFGVANNAALGNIVQYNQVGVRALGVSTGSGVCYTTWLGNTRKLVNTAKGLVVTPKV